MIDQDLKPIEHEIVQILRSSDEKEGVNKNDLMRRIYELFPTAPVGEIQDSFNELINDGLVYNTIDEYFKAN
eukprot:CAMPEP_0171451558 /NCGR_PEP_ID=MMETSP0945-20130129/20_1 /TAXON_ID=109269 /ORGANISM="Vaucheria litorea, Strain CCMP2940" /LENGTH=71 /DNA_ID=CAMNT_0011976053 /DNA_START=611 /DNA_END=826 /DNA_ORIENTATION=+